MRLRQVRMGGTLCLGLCLPLFLGVVLALVPPSTASASSCNGNLGSDTPVLLVHGFNSGPGIWREGPISMFKAIDGLAGTHVETFDYSSSSRNWVTDKKIGRALAERIACLSQASAEAGGPGRVVVVAHSMGGLATRQAASETVDGVSIGSRIGLVITLGTPNTGSWVNSVGLRGPQSGVESAAQTLLFNVLAAKCQDLDTGELIDGVCQFIEAGGSDAAKAMRFGSPQLKELPSLPSDIPVLAMAGDIRVGTHIWNKPLFLPGRAGDIVVGRDSAQANASSIEGFGGAKADECDYFVLQGADFGPCFHNALLNSGTMQAHVVRAVREWNDAQLAITREALLNATLPDDICSWLKQYDVTWPVPSRLADGELVGVSEDAPSYSRVWIAGEEEGASPGAFEHIQVKDADLDGSPDGLIVLTCTAGGSGYTNELWIFLSSKQSFTPIKWGEGFQTEGLTNLSLVGDRIEVRYPIWSRGDYGCCPTREADETMIFDGVGFKRTSISISERS